MKVGILSTAHMHAWGYASALKANPRSALIGVADENSERGKELAARYEVPLFSSYEELAEQCDAVCVASENVKHRALVEIAASKKCHIMCEKPLCTTEEDGRAMLAACDAAGVQLATCFPCRYSPAFLRLVERVESREIGDLLAVCATNHGMMPQNSWFNIPALSGGGAMMDHAVHVSDLLRVLLRRDPVEVYAETGNGMYHGDFDDIAMVTVQFANGVFATIDSSWSRPVSYKVWGDVTMNVVGTKGVIEMDMFGQAFLSYSNKDMRVREIGYGSNIDAALMEDWLAALEEGRPVPVSGTDGFKAAQVPIAGYQAAKTHRPVRIS